MSKIGGKPRASLATKKCSKAPRPEAASEINNPTEEKSDNTSSTSCLLMGETETSSVSNTEVEKKRTWRTQIPAPIQVRGRSESKRSASVLPVAVKGLQPAKGLRSFSAVRKNSTPVKLECLYSASSLDDRTPTNSMCIIESTQTAEPGKQRRSRSMCPDNISLTAAKEPLSPLMRPTLPLNQECISTDEALENPTPTNSIHMRTPPLSKSSNKISGLMHRSESMHSLPNISFETGDCSHEARTGGEKRKCKKPKMDRPRMNAMAQQRINRLKDMAAKPPADVPLIRRIGDRPQRRRAKSHPTQPRREVTRSSVFEDKRICALKLQHKKLQDLQTDFMNKLRINGQTGRDQLPGVYKFVSLVLNNDSKFVVHDEDILQLPKNIPPESVADLKNRCRAVIDSGFQCLYENLASLQESPNEMDPLQAREELRQRLQALRDAKEETLSKEIGEICSSTAADTARLHTEIHDLRIERALWYDKYCSAVEDRKLLQKLEKQQQADLDEYSNHISELQKIYFQREEQVDLQESNLTYKDNEINLLNATNVLLQHKLDISAVNELRLQTTLNDARECNKKLQLELFEAREIIVGLEVQTHELEHPDKNKKDALIAELQIHLKEIEEQRDMLSKRINKAVQLRFDYEDLKRVYSSALSQMNELQMKADSDKAAATENQIKSEQKLLEELEQCKKDLQNSEKLVTQLQKQAEWDRQLLALRSETIDNLQQKEQDYLKQLDQMYYQVSEKKTLIAQVNFELASKSKEFDNLFQTLAHKQIDLRRAEHVIQLLEENNMRSSIMRIKQEERNAKIKEDIVQLKRTIRTYAKIIIASRGQPIFESVPSDEQVPIDTNIKNPQSNFPCVDANCQFHKAPQQRQRRKQ